MSRPLNILQVCDHLGWEGSRMHGVKRLFAWMIPRFDKARVNVSLVSLRKKDLSEETLESLGVDIEYLDRGKFDPATQRSAAGAEEVALLPLTETPVDEDTLTIINARLSGHRVAGAQHPA